MPLLAITRGVSPGIARCELTHLERERIDLDAAVRQHGHYERLLVELGCGLLSLPAQAELPDSVFVEDTAVVLDECAIITRPGAESRRPETASVAAVLSGYRRLLHIEPPGTLDGGDLLRVRRILYVGTSGRTNGNGVEQLRTLVRPYGYTVVTVPVRKCLHLKSGATCVGEDTLLVNPDWVDPGIFVRTKTISVHREEPMAGNALLIGDTAVYPTQYPRTLSRLEAAGIHVRTTNVSELAKAEGGVTCCSLIFGIPENVDGQTNTSYST